VGIAGSSSNSAAGAVSGSLSASGSKSSINGNSSSVTITNPAVPNNTPNIYAPGLAAAGSEVCLGSMSAGGAGAGFGLTLAGTMVDRECQLRLNARTLAVLGYPKAAREVMCLDVDVRNAMAAAGTPCAADQGGGTKARAALYNGPAPNQPSALNQVSLLAPSSHHCEQVDAMFGGSYEKCD